MSKVAVLGAAGGIGQPLSLLLKLNKYVKHLSLYDVAPVTPGVAADLGHIPTRAKVTGHTGNDQLKDALTGCDVVVIPAGVPRKPGMTRDDLFNTNATIVQTLATGCAQFCPDAKILIISNPVNSTVPIVAETFKKYKVYNPKTIFGVTSLDVCRANTFVAELKNLDPSEVDINVVGGHAGITILPLFSQFKGATFTQEELEPLTHRVQFGGDEVVKAKAGAGSATLSMALAGERFTAAVLRALHGEAASECAFVESDVAPVPFFASRVDLGPEGVKKIHGLGQLSAFEQAKLDPLYAELKASIEKGIAFAK